ncbi:cold-responsive protein kinase 1-like isoform X2 [Telopea speciosissima]|uniref:cold-responsive protein kinase 1-like isoform X2 n=1 Tax=Telopea speciosissima TaxID=54955 RepID=UPI001CC527DD|nr:cold-responsive protein kinase 1-like isoform X2 [Telopea speciosissima]
MSCRCFGSCRVKRKNAHAHAHAHQDANVSLGRNIKIFSFNELRSATNSFHVSSRLGRGGFGTVYKGILTDGTQVAVKTLSAGSRQGVNEFLTEIQTVTNVKHPNLVELLGCCIQENNRILVYEYVENNSLDRALFGSMSKTIKLDWSRRSAICIGTARGLAFLHEELEPHIVHRDIKASNILLDKDFVPKIGDFGMAKLFPENITHISTRIAGTTGYLAPEYARHGQLTKKADVYSFGVVVLEIISGRSSAKAKRGETQKFLLEWIWELYEGGQLLELVDPGVGEYSEEEVLRYIKVALFCTQAAASRRPTMTQVVDMLSRSIRLNEKELTPPGFFRESGGLSGYLPSSSNKESIDSTTTTTRLDSSPSSITEVDPR